MGINTQLYVGKKAPDAAMMNPIKNQPYFCKAMGGLWTSTYDDHYLSGWVDWCRYEMPHWLYDGWLLYPKQDAKLLVIDSYDDLMAAMNKYDICSDFGRFASLNFEEIAKEYDGVRLTDRGQAETRWTFPSLYGWDCESIHWFRFAFEKVEPIGDIAALLPTED